MNNFSLVVSGKITILHLLFGISLCSANYEYDYADENSARKFLENYDKETDEPCHQVELAHWTYETDMTEINKNLFDAKKKSYNDLTNEKIKESKLFFWKKFKDPFIRRQFELLVKSNTDWISDSSMDQMNEISGGINDFFSTVVNSDPVKESVSGGNLTEWEKEFKRLLLSMADNFAPMRHAYSTLIHIMHESIEDSDFTSFYEYDTQSFEIPNLFKEMNRIWSQVKPFYQELHAHVRHKLRVNFGPEVVPPGNSPIPEHLSDWSGSMNILMDFETSDNVKDKVTETMKIRDMKPFDMARIAENFFVSLGFPPLPSEFWSGSILEKSKSKQMICHPSAWDMCDRKDFRIRQCTDVDMDGLMTLYHELGHIFYHIQCKHLPKIFRVGANPGFYEAIGDLITLSVRTQEYLHSVDLLDSIDEEDEHSDINYLLSLALDEIRHLPYGLIFDKWRWDVFDGKVNEENYNCHWWKLRLRYSGFSPSDYRTEDYFDPGLMYHVATNSGYARYFISMIIQFQLHESLCIIAGKFNLADPLSPPLHKCNIQGNKAAGAKLMEILRLGSSKPWPDVMEIITGQRNIDAKPLLDYFKPLHDWLKLENIKNNATIGWNGDVKPHCGPRRNSRRRPFSSDLQTGLYTLSGAIIVGIIFGVFVLKRVIERRTKTTSNG